MDATKLDTEQPVNGAYTTSNIGDDETDNVNVFIKEDDLRRKALTSQKESTDSHVNPITFGRGFLWKVRKDSGYRIRLLHTFFVVWMFINLGWAASVGGSTFPDQRLIIKKDLATASWLPTAGALGYLLGALLFGILFDRFNRLLILMMVTSLSAISLASIPWCANFALMLGMSGVCGFFSGGIDVGGNSHIASIWGQKAAPFMQAIHFGFSFGGILSPFTAEPFLAPKHCLEPPVVTNESTVISPNNSTLQNETTCKEIFGETHIHYAYLIAGFMHLSATIPFLVLYCISSRHDIYVDTSISEQTFESQRSLPNFSVKQKVLFVSLLMILISLYGCVEGRFASLLSTFVSEYLQWTTTTGLHVTSLFWGMFAMGRLLGILVTRFLTTPTMVVVYFTVLALSFVGFLLGSMYNIVYLVWACTGLAGLGMSSIFPAIFTWTAESILTVTGKISAIYLVGVSVFNMILPLLYGYLMQSQTQMYFPYLELAQTVLCIAVYVTIRILLHINVYPVVKQK